MGKNKLKRFDENRTFRCLVQVEGPPAADHPLKGAWHREFFGNDRPIILELGCGRGEYTVELGRRFPDRNFIGVDIKGARLWRGAKTATEEPLPNVGFLRTRIEFIDRFFAAGEVAEIWITFPDPQLKKGREKKRLTAADFLARYARFLHPEGVVHLKTDSQPLHRYTRAVLEANGIEPALACDDIYGKGVADELLSIKTTYEARFLAEGLPITYLRWSPCGRSQFVAPVPTDE